MACERLYPKYRKAWLHTYVCGVAIWERGPGYKWGRGVIGQIMIGPTHTHSPNATPIQDPQIIVGIWAQECEESPIILSEVRCSARVRPTLTLRTGRV